MSSHTEQTLRVPLYGALPRARKLAPFVGFQPRPSAVGQHATGTEVIPAANGLSEELNRAAVTQNITFDLGVFEQRLRDSGAISLFYAIWKECSTRPEPEGIFHLLRRMARSQQPATTYKPYFTQDEAETLFAQIRARYGKPNLNSSLFAAFNDKAEAVLKALKDSPFVEAETLPGVTAYATSPEELAKGKEYFVANFNPAGLDLSTDDKQQIYDIVNGLKGRYQEKLPQNIGEWGDLIHNILASARSTWSFLKDEPENLEIQMESGYTLMADALKLRAIEDWLHYHPEAHAAIYPKLTVKPDHLHGRSPIVDKVMFVGDEKRQAEVTRRILTNSIGMDPQNIVWVPPSDQTLPGNSPIERIIAQVEAVKPQMVFLPHLERRADWLELIGKLRAAGVDYIVPYLLNEEELAPVAAEIARITHIEPSHVYAMDVDFMSGLLGLFDRLTLPATAK